MALFEKTLNERREAFVRARFAESQYFGFEEIEDWLKSQPEAERPDMSRWTKLLSGKFWQKFGIGSQRSLLNDCATPIHALGREAISQSTFIRIHSLFMPGLYWGMHEGIYIDPCDDAEMKDVFFVLREVDDRLIVERLGVPFKNSCFSSEIFLWVLLAEWDGKRPKLRNARSILCVELMRAVKKEREKAQMDFNYSVATSEDGTRIVRADWVVVIEGEKATLFPEYKFSDSCLGQKAKLGIECEARFHIQTLKNTQESVLEFLRRDDYTHVYDFEKRTTQYQIFSCGPQTSSFKMLFIRKDFCLDPLPSGGIEVV